MLPVESVDIPGIFRPHESLVRKRRRPMDTISFVTASSTTVCELAERRLRESPYFFLRWLSCRFDHGTLTLQGRVPNRRLREFAELIVARVEGVQSVDNRIEVCDPSVWSRSA